MIKSVRLTLIVTVKALIMTTATIVTAAAILVRI